MQQLRGTGVALITPFTEDLSVDTLALKKLVDHVIAGGVDYLVVLGTTAESATLSTEEKEQVISIVVEATAERVPLVLGMGGNDTARICEELKLLDLSHFSAILSVSPYYSRPTQAGIYAHFEQVAAASPLPIILYNVPARTGSNVLPETAIKLAKDFKNIVGIKEAAGDMVQVLQLIKNKPENFMIISGDDMLALPTVLAGGDGVISVIGQGLPEIFSTMMRDGLSGKIKEANAAQYKILDMIALIFTEGNPAGIKALLSLKEISSARVRLPLLGASEDLTKKIATKLEQL